MFDDMQLNRGERNVHRAVQAFAVQIEQQYGAVWERGKNHRQVRVIRPGKML
jgi:hypothetical protein